MCMELKPSYSNLESLTSKSNLTFLNGSMDLFLAESLRVRLRLLFPTFLT